jgi:hypothetical protein
LVKRLRIIEATRTTGNHVCTWCAATFSTKSELLTHRILNPDCAKNRSISNQTQTKYNAPGVVKTVHGEEILRRVRSRDCDHIATQPILNEEGIVWALQCIWCYTYFPVPQGGDSGDSGNLVDTQGSPDGQQ